jgi:HPt (histidine-containing phosphotransfer) domain-containing protein
MGRSLETPELNRTAMLAAVGGKADLLREALGAFLAQLPQTIEGGRAGLATGDGESLRKAAHRLRGSAMQFALPELVASTSETESLARAGDFPAAAAAWERLEILLNRLAPALRLLIDES